MEKNARLVPTQNPLFGTTTIMTRDRRNNEITDDNFDLTWMIVATIVTLNGPMLLILTIKAHCPTRRAKTTILRSIHDEATLSHKQRFGNHHLPLLLGVNGRHPFRRREQANSQDRHHHQIGKIHQRGEKDQQCHHRGLTAPTTSNGKFKHLQYPPANQLKQYEMLFFQRDPRSPLGSQQRRILHLGNNKPHILRLHRHTGKVTGVNVSRRNLRGNVPLHLLTFLL